MKIPLTKYGLPQVAVFPAIILLIMAVVAFFGPAMFVSWIVQTVLAIFLVVLIWVLSFFRDPARIPPDDPNLLISPADGKVTDIDIIEHDDITGKKTVRIGIFLSVFNVHINRMPCPARIEKITYKKGHFKNAMNPESSRVNESNEVLIKRLNQPADNLFLRQISGAIARRIVCKASIGEDFCGGQQFGMIKFGSRTELLLPARDDIEISTKIGDKVKAGITILARYKV